MPFFQKKPVIIEAVRFENNSSTYDLLDWANHHINTADTSAPLIQWINDKLIISTLEGPLTASVIDLEDLATGRA